MIGNAKFVDILAVIVVVMVFTFFSFVVFFGDTFGKSAHDIILILIGALSSALSTVIGYYFGSSKGSNDKAETINKLIH